MFSLFKRTLTFDYANFQGRASRKEYWCFHLSIITICVMIEIIFFFLIYYGGLGIIAANIMTIAILIFLLAMFIPSLALSVRRMHDTGNTGWFSIIPIVSLVLALMPGDRGENKYGSDPREMDNML